GVPLVYESTPSEYELCPQNRALSNYLALDPCARGRPSVGGAPGCLIPGTDYFAMESGSKAPDCEKAEVERLTKGCKLKYTRTTNRGMNDENHVVCPYAECRAGM